MSTDAAVNLWGTRIGAVTLDDGRRDAIFQYDDGFLPSSIELSPLTMPLRAAPYVFPGLPVETFHGLPGMLADSLPDRFGNALIDAWLATQGRGAEDFNAVERLCYTGLRGMGALEFAPARGPTPQAVSQDIQVDALVRLASEVLSNRSAFVASFADGGEADALKQILSVGTSAGGARAKAVIAYNPATQAVRSGQVDVDAGFEHWLLKFDGVSGNKDKELDDPQGYGAIEFAYYEMARAAGIDMMESRLLEEGGRRHFITRRFDRTDDGDKLHMQSLGAVAHFDFNAPGAYSYEQAISVIRRLALGPDAVEQQFRRMAFNVIARNQDDHVKNIAFIMDRRGRWSLSPAFDVAYSYAPSGLWTNQHQMTVNGKRDGFALADFTEVGRVASMRRGRAVQLVDEVREAVRGWKRFAETAKVDEESIARIARAQRVELPRE